jgi:hypothetical protein
VFLVSYELGFYVPEDGILHSHGCENLKSYLVHRTTRLSGREQLQNSYGTQNVKCSDDVV